jgi:hypothetical protein
VEEEEGEQEEEEEEEEEECFPYSLMYKAFKIPEAN